MQKHMFTRRSFLAASAFGLAGAAFGAGAGRANAAATDRKNIICILCDDMGAEELGCYGNRVHHTPNLDALAASGTRFETFYAAPVCSPTRVCLMTGRYGFRTGWCNMRGRSAGSPPRDDVDLARDERNFGQLLEQDGYATGFVGKWQLTGDRLETMLSDAGFAESLIWIYTGYLAKGESYQGGYYPPKSTKKSSRYWHPGLARNGVHFATTPEEYGPDMFCDFSLEFIREHAREPFFLYYPMALIHRPWVATPDTPELEGENKSAHLKANVEYTDKIIGKLVAELDAQGIRENTVIMFLGDNGTQDAGKSSPTEWGARVPFILNCPGTIPGGLVSRELSDISDVLPTMLDYAGVDKPADLMLDGISLAPYLRGETETHRDMIFSFLGQYRILRNKHYLLEQNSADDFGQFFYCGESRDGRNYVDVTESQDPEHAKARKLFEMCLMGYLVPPTTREERAEFEAFTIPKIESLNRHLARLDSRIPLRRVPPMPSLSRKGRRVKTDADDE